MSQKLIWISLLVASFGLITSRVNGQLSNDSVRIAISDGSELTGKLDDATKLVFQIDGQTGPVDLETVQMVAISKFRQKNIEELKLVVNQLVEQLGSPKWSERESATLELSKLKGPVGWILDDLRGDQSLETTLRISRIMNQLGASRDQILDPRDLVIVSGQVKRGWVSSTELKVVTEIGRFTFDLNDVTQITNGSYETSEDVELPSPRKHQQGLDQGEIPLAVHLFGGSKLIGKVRSEKLNAAVSLELGMSIKRENKEDRFLTEEGIEFELSPQTLELLSVPRRWQIPSTKIKSIFVKHSYTRDGALGQLVHQLILANGDATKVAQMRFWVHINDQPANPWNSNSGRAMTWSLQKVDGEICMVGADEQTEPYKGDTSLKKALPILCIKKSNFPMPNGLKTTYYGGWTGGEIRITRPIQGERLTSLKMTNELIRKELGEGWQIAEFHDGKGGWKWWAHWRKPK